MAIKIIKGADVPVEHLIVVLYGPPGIGKTSLALTAANPLLLDFDGGVKRAPNHAFNDVVSVQSWSDVDSLTPADLEGYDTIIIDTLGSALESMIVEMIARDPKMGRGGGQPSMQGWGALKVKFAAFLSLLQRSNRDIVVVAHASEEMRGEEAVERIHAQGSSKQLVYQQADLMGRMSKDGKAVLLTFDPTASAYGKNCGLDDVTVKEPSLNPTLLADLIAEAKGLLDTASARQNAEFDRLAQLRAEFESLPVTAAAYNEKAQVMKDAGLNLTDARLLIQVGEEQGLVFDRSDGVRKFVDPVPEEERAPEEEPDMTPEATPPAPAPSPVAEAEPVVAGAGLMPI